MADQYTLSERGKDNHVEMVRRMQDGSAQPPRDKGPRRSAEQARTVRTSASNAGSTWTAAKLVNAGDPLPPNRGGGAATGEDVQVQPLYGVSFTSGGVTFPAHTLDSGNDYLIAHDSGTTDGGTPPKRRLYVMPIGLVACVSGTLRGL